MKTKTITVLNHKIDAIKDLISENNHVNLVLDMQNSAVANEALEEIFQFAKTKNENGTTFVVVKEPVDFDSFSEEWNVVPTLEEANDLISLDEMMRDLE